jgi:hypothetical protein
MIFFRSARTYTPLSVVLHLGEEGNKLHQYLPDVKLPSLIIQGEQDKVVSFEKMKQTLEQIGSEDKTFLSFGEVYHDVHHEPEKDQVLQAIFDWISKRTNTKVTSNNVPSATTASSNSDKIQQTPTEKKEQSIKETKAEEIESKKTTEETQTSEEMGSPTLVEKASSTSPTPNPNKRTAADFQFINVLGQGAFGEVKLAVETKTGKQFAIKMLDKKHIIDSGKKKYVQTERNIFNILSHPNVVKLFYTFQDPKTLCKQLNILYMD